MSNSMRAAERDERSDVLMECYSRAAQLSAPKLAAVLPGVAVDGYWLNDEQFYFLSETLHVPLGRVVATPSIANCTTGRVEEVISLDAIAALLSECEGRSIDVPMLAAGRFDMPHPHTLVLALSGRDYHIDVRMRSLARASDSWSVPALYSPDGRHACFVKGHDLWLKERDTGVERPLTTDGSLHHCYGQQPESCMGAIPYRQSPGPMGFWSADSQWFLTHRIDERSVPELPLVQHVPPQGGRPILHRYRQPLPGDPVPIATYVAIHIPSGRAISFEDFPTPCMIFSPISRYRRMAWFSGPNTVNVLRLDRYFKQVDFIELDLARGTGRIVFSENTASGWLEFHQMGGTTPNMRALAQSREVIWWSERDGWGHLYLYDAVSGQLKNRITSGEWLVRDIVHVDERERTVLFTACGLDAGVDPVRRSLCSIKLDGTGFEVLCAHDGDISLPKTEPWGLAQERPFCPPNAQPGVSPSARFGVVLYASVERGNVTRIVDLVSRRQGFTIASALPAHGEVRPHCFSALAADGVTRLHGVMFFPSDFNDRRRYPLIDYIYPGPQVTQQPQSFGSSWAAFARALAELGFITIMIDTRAMPFRSRALHQSSYGELLEPQLADHNAVARQLCERHPYLDATRVGMIGLSGGGLATARALLDYGATFKVGVSVCGNHDNRLIVSGWSDKYCGPGTSEQWAEQSNAAVAHKLTGQLLLISGDMDENVHISHTFSLVNALVRANRDFELLIVPNEGHLLLMTNGYVQRRAWDHFVRHLLGQKPPPQFELKFASHELARMEEGYMRGLL